MPYNQPLPRTSNIQDEWCTTATSSCGECGAPSVVQNINLEKKPGGSPGFLAVSKHMCVGLPCATVFRKEVDLNVTGFTGDVKYCQSTGSDTSGYPFDNRVGSDCPTGQDCGCNQFRDYNNSVVGTTIIPSPGGQDYKTPKTSSHIIKLVSNDYWRRDCIQTASSTKQNKVIYANQCVENVGNNDRGISSGIRYYLRNCNSYAMNLNPEGNRLSDQHKCCVPKTSGPFHLETNYKNALFSAIEESIRNTGRPPNGPILEKIYDSPVSVTLFPETPDYTLLSDNLLYNMQNRIHCDCDENGCIELPEIESIDTCLESPCTAGCPDENNCTVCPNSPNCEETEDQCLISPCTAGCPDANNCAVCPDSPNCGGACATNPCNSGCPDANNCAVCPNGSGCGVDCGVTPCATGCPLSTSCAFCYDEDRCGGGGGGEPDCSGQYCPKGTPGYSTTNCVCSGNPCSKALNVIICNCGDAPFDDCRGDSGCTGYCCCARAPSQGA